MKNQEGPPGAPRPTLSRCQTCASEAETARRLLREQTQGICTLRGEVLDAVVDGLLEDILAFDVRTPDHTGRVEGRVETTAPTDDHCPKLRLVGTDGSTEPDDEPCPPTVRVPGRGRSCDSSPR